MNFSRPDRLDDALSLLAGGEWTILSGGTDFYPALGDRRPQGNVLDISAIGALRGISEHDDHWRIGALTTWSDVARARLPAAFEGLQLAALEIGSIQIQNRATVAGNICNASPAADGVPPLLTLDAVVRLSCARGTRDVALAEFATGNGTTVLRADELVTDLVVPKAAARGRSGFVKLGARKYLVISLTMVAARLDWDDRGVVTQAAISVGSCSLVAQRLPALERELIGRSVSRDLAGLVKAAHFAALSPIDDVRASSTYRLQATIELVRRALADLAPGGR